LHIDPNVGYEGIDIVEVGLIAMTPESVCHDDASSGRDTSIHSRHR
jgi:hypothetical protein